jgi:hypothetical protein
MKISTILDKIDEAQLFVPAFQREYVWKREDAKELLDSLIKTYPTGTMLTWETNQPPQLKGSHRYDQRQGAVKILLDGQQRITTLYANSRRYSALLHGSGNHQRHTWPLHQCRNARTCLLCSAEDGEGSTVAEHH